MRTSSSPTLLAAGSAGGIAGRLAAAGVLTTALLTGLPTAAHATGGFGTDGTVTTDFTGSWDNGNAIVAYGQGYVVGGMAGKTNANGGNVPDFSLVRYTKNGSLDASFGAGGKVTTEFFGDNDEINALATQTDGKIVAAGAAFTGGGSNPDFALARYTATGALDASFGTGGKVTTNIGSHDVATGVAIQADGKIVVSGYSTVYPSSKSFVVTRYHTDGSLDTSFGTGGKATAQFSGYDEANALAIQKDGKIVVAGQVGGTDFALARFTTNGSPDATFDGDGKVTTDFGGNDRAVALTIQKNGKIIAAGQTATYGGGNFALARYNADGGLDASFDGEGKVTTDIAGNDDRAQAVAVRHGRIVVGGTGVVDNAYSFALVGYTSSGSLDSSFGTGGKITSSVGGIYSEINALVVKGNGAVVAAGTAYPTYTHADFAVAKYQP